MKHLGLWAIVCGTALAGGAVVSGVAVADSLQVEPTAAQHLAVSGVSTESPALGVTTVTVSDDTTTAKKPVKEVPPSDPVTVDPKKVKDDPAKHACDGVKDGTDDPKDHDGFGEHWAFPAPTSGTTGGSVHHHRHGGFGH